MTTYEFLSDEWFAAVQAVLNEGKPVLPEALAGLVINIVIQDANIDTTYRGCWWEPGHSDDAEATLLTTKELAFEVMVKKNIPLGVRAISTGKAKIKGNRTKLMKLRVVKPSESQAAFEQRVAGFTHVTPVTVGA
jgi:hypothetical protein